MRNILAKTKKFSISNVQKHYMPDQPIENTQELTPLESIGSTLAEALNKQDNPLEAEENDSFVARPFFEEEEEIKEEVVAETEATEAKEPELNEDGTVKEPVVETTPITPDQIPEEAFIGLLKGAINDPEISFDSLEDIKQAFEDSKKFKEANGQLQGLSQEERARIEVGREFGDFGLFDRVMGIDTNKISHKEALRQVFFLDNIGKNIQFLEKTFERDFARTYDEEPDEEFSKMSLENNGQEAIDKIIEVQEGLKKRGQISGSADQEDAKKAKIEEDNKWFAEVDKVIEKNDRVTYTLEDGLVINIVMDAKDKNTIRDAMDNPIGYMKSQFTDETGKVDHEDLLEFVLRNMYYETALNEAKKSGAAFREDKILKEKKNAVIENPKAGSADTRTNVSDQIASNLSRLINY